MTRQTVYILLTMDCESAKVDVTDHASSMSASGPSDYAESERSIRGYVEAVGTAGYPVTLLAHPEVAAAQPDLMQQSILSFYDAKTVPDEEWYGYIKHRVQIACHFWLKNINPA